MLVKHGDGIQRNLVDMTLDAAKFSSRICPKIVIVKTAALSPSPSQLRRRGHLRPQREGRVGEVEGAAQAGGGEVGVQRRRRAAVGEAKLVRRRRRLFLVGGRGGKFAVKEEP